MTDFDLISDLYLTTLDGFSWENKATSLYCIVAGNIAAERTILFKFFEHIQQYYNMVFFIDGELEHTGYNNKLSLSYQNLTDGIEKFNKIMFLHENIIIINNATLIGANGWTTFDFTNKSPVNITMDYLASTGLLSEDDANQVFKLAVEDQHYLFNSVDQCQLMEECVNIVFITNTVPVPGFIDHNEDFNGTVLGDTTGNNGITGCLANDKYNKAHTWIFGKFHEPLDYNINGLRYVSNPGKEIDLAIYYPKRIEI